MTTTDVSALEPEHVGDRRVVDGGDFLHFEIVIAAAKGTHLVALSLLGLLRDVTRLGVFHLAVLFDAIEVRGFAPATIHRPLGDRKSVV